MILGAVGLLVVAVALPRVVGGGAYTVLTGSMRPGLPPGTLVVTRPVEPAEVRIGDVVTYQLESGEATVATHRVVGLGQSMQGERTFTTRGDANGAVDPEPVRAVQVRGRLWYAVPYVGHVNSYLTGEQRAVGRLAVAGLLLGYAAVMLVGGIRERRRGEVTA